MFFAKRAEDKDHPQGILNLVRNLSSHVASIHLTENFARPI